MKSLHTGMLALLALGVTSANAGGLGERGSIKDGPYATPFSWTGLYIGGHVGGGWGSQKVSLERFSGVISRPFSSFENDPNATFAGLQAGYNWQLGNIVFGVEAVLGAMALDHKATAPSAPLVEARQSGGRYGRSSRLRLWPRNGLHQGRSCFL